MTRITSGSGSRGARVIALIAVLLISIGGGMAFMPDAVRAQTPVPEATPDPFYAAPETVPADPGVLVRAEPFTREVPAAARA